MDCQEFAVKILVGRNTEMAEKGENIFQRKDERADVRCIKNKKSGRTHSPERPLQPTMLEVGTWWLGELSFIRKKSTLVKYSSQFENHLVPVFGDKRIDEISNEDMIAFCNGLLTGTGNGGEKLSPKTVSDILSRMKSIRKFALIHGYEVGFIADCVSLPQTEEEIRVLSLSEEKKLLGYLKTHTDLTNLGIILCLFTGIRIGELCALTWNDISLAERELYIRRTMQRLRNLNDNAEKRTYIDIDRPKSRRSVRAIPIPDNIFEDLRVAYVTDAFVLTGEKKRFVEPRTMENRFKTILRECDIEDANFHALRHTFATRCVEVGFDIKSLSEILGHANVNITLNRYVHPTMQLKRDNMNRLSDLYTVR